MNAQPPLPERAVPDAVARRLRASIMATTSAAAPRHRLTGIWVAAAIVALLVGGGLVADRYRPGIVAASPPPVPSSSDRIVATDLGPLSAAATEATVSGCLRPEDPALDRVVSARRLSDGRTRFALVVYRNVDDQIVVCSERQNGPTYGGTRGYLPTARVPVVPLGGPGSGSWMPDQGTPEPTSARDYTSGQFFAAGPDVDTVQLRVVVDGRAGAWFAGQVHDGFVYIPVFEAGPVPLSANGEPQVRLESRAFDRNGSPVAIKN